MDDITIYFWPGACSRVTLVALEEIGLDYTAVEVGFDRDPEIKVSSRYRTINSKGEVPALAYRGRILTQSAAILHFLAAQYPTARLLPDPGTIGINEALEDLVWCSSTLHILRRQVLNPPRFTKGELDGVREKGVESWQQALTTITDRLSKDEWWYGDQWSIVDVYLNWTFSGTRERNADLSGEPKEQDIGVIEQKLALAERPVLLDHARRVRSRPSFCRAIEREKTGTKLS